MSNACTSSVADGKTGLSINSVGNVAGEEEHSMEELLLAAVRDAVSARDLFILDLTDNFFEIGGNLVTAAITVRKLRETGYEVDLEYFCNAKHLRDVVDGMHRRSYTPYELVYGIQTLKDCDVTRTQCLSRDYQLIPFSEASELELGQVFDFAHRMLVQFDPFLLTSDMNDTDKQVFIAAALREIFHNHGCQSLSFFIRHRRRKDIGGTVLSADFCFQCHPSHEGIPCLPLNAYLQTLFSLEKKQREILHVTSPGEIACQVVSILDFSVEPPTNQLLLQRLLIAESVRTARRQGYKKLIGFHGNPLLQECATEAGFKTIDASEQLKGLQFKKTKPFANIRPANYRIVVMATDLVSKVKVDNNENTNEVVEAR